MMPITWQRMEKGRCLHLMFTILSRLRIYVRKEYHMLCIGCVRIPYRVRVRIYNLRFFLW